MNYLNFEHRLPIKERFDEIYEELKRGTDLNLSMLHYIFGRQFFELMCLSLMPECKCKTIEDVKEMVTK